MNGPIRVDLNHGPRTGWLSPLLEPLPEVMVATVGVLRESTRFLSILMKPTGSLFLK